ncbi:GNAT family N-acetyltransferase [Kribbella sp. NBC_00382]|uniref:GNAT family N-acetyltransferase n=1 Tax=Kribbella sp. NBC_00382 TaxID=2975967 RepID=UPI002E1F636D
MQVWAIDQDGLRQVEQWLAADPVGGAIFGGFYGHAVDRWTPLLQAPSRHGWITFDETGPIGFIDLEVLDDEAEITYYVSPAHRGRGLGHATVDQVVQLATAVGARQVHASVDPDNAASIATLRAAAFTDEGTNEFNEAEFTLDLPDPADPPGAVGTAGSAGTSGGGVDD